MKATSQILTSNPLEFDENFFPFLKEEIVDKLLNVDEEIDILFKASTLIRWLSYDPNMRVGTSKRVSMGSDRHLVFFGQCFPLFGHKCYFFGQTVSFWPDPPPFGHTPPLFGQSPLLFGRNFPPF